MVTSTFMPQPVQIWGWTQALRCSTLNGSWQGQGLVSQAPPKPSHCRSAELLWPGPQAVSPPCTTSPPASQAGAVLRSPGEHSWKPGGTALHLSSPKTESCCSALLQSVPCTMLTHRKVVRSYTAKNLTHFSAQEKQTLVGLNQNSSCQVAKLTTT